MSLIITTSYDGPDLDGYGCAVAYAELLRAQGKDAEAHIWGEPQLEVQWLVKTFGLDFVSATDDCRQATVILLDASNPEDLPSPLTPDQVVEVIDHRKIHRGQEFKNATLQIELVGAAATLVAERFQNVGVTPSKQSALLLYGGILSNTQNFTAVTTDRDREMAQWLRTISEAPNDLVERMFRAKSDLRGDRLQTALLGDSKVFTIQGKVIGTAVLEIFDVHKLILERRQEIEEVLTKIQKKNFCDYVFGAVKDLQKGVTFILCIDEQTFKFFQSAPDITWDGWLGESKVLTLRKQIMVWIDERLKTGYV